VGLRREEQLNANDVQQSDDFLLLDPHSDPADDGHPYGLRADDLVIDTDASARGSGWVRAGQIALVLAGLGWVGFAAYLLAMRDFRLPAPEQIPLAIASMTTPLVLLAILYLILARGSMGEATRFARITSQLRKDADALDMRLAIVNQQLDAARQTMRDQASLLEEYGGAASLNLESAAKTLTQHASTSAHQAEIIERAGLSLAAQFGRLIDAMPDIEQRTGRVSQALAANSDTLDEKVERLEARIETFSRLLEEARTRTGTTTQSLTAQLMRIQDATRSASDEVTGMADISSSRIETAIDAARKAIDEAGMALDMRTSELNVLVEQSRSALSSIGGQAVVAYGEGIAQIETRLRDLDALVQERAEAIGDIGRTMSLRIEGLSDEFAQLQSVGAAGSERIGEVIEALTRRTQSLDAALDSGQRTAEAIIARTESLLVALDASVRELDESHPAALARLNDKIDTSQRLLGVIMPEIEHLEALSGSVLDHARQSEELLSGQQRKLRELLHGSENTLSGCREQVDALNLAIESADTGARRLSDSAGPQMVATLLRIKETAEHAGERAREAMFNAITEAGNALGEATDEALSNQLGERFQQRIEEVSTIAERAVQAAHAASDRLMRQLITIADTTAAIEQRISEADNAAQRREQDAFSRRSAQLIESLNSIAIDVTKILSGEVSDTLWAAYLKGDRGVFSRRAVRLIDTTEAQQIFALYQRDTGFQDGVNRYIHDFEAMLRNILTTRDGASIAVTLLSSDIGKLYVALAQAIDRLKD
jgi:DNA anti-recombination protein RmuC